MEDQPTYRKHNSFVGLRSKASIEHALEKIDRCIATLDSGALPDTQRLVVRNAVLELKTPDQQFELRSNVAEEINRLSDAEVGRYLYYRYRYEVYPQRLLLDDFPPCLQIEPTSICNYRCVFCYQTDKSFAQKSSGHMGNMSLDLFKGIIDQAEGRCEAVTLASRGEPLIAPEFEKMLSYTRDKFLALKVNTNAWFLDERHSHAILSAGVNTVVFSADAAAEPLYSQLRVGGQLERILQNIRLFGEIRAKRYPHSRTITRVSGVRVPGTPDLDEMERFWGSLVDQVAFVEYNPWENTYLRPINDIEKPCSDLWRRMFVWWDGRVNPCDVDYKSELSVGRVPELTLSDLWRSDAYMSLRERHLMKQRNSLFPCQRCTLV
jgi:MoaA/NifB/PqqE/SkfB family radical SAM enzyme